LNRSIIFSRRSFHYVDSIFFIFSTLILGYFVLVRIVVYYEIQVQFLKDCLPQIRLAIQVDLNEGIIAEDEAKKKELMLQFEIAQSLKKKSFLESIQL